MIPLIVAAVALSAAAADVTPCERLASQSSPDATNIRAQTVAAGQFRPPAGRAGARGDTTYEKLSTFCRIEAALTPSRDSAIAVELWLPAAGWNGKLLVVGNGAWGGSITYPVMAAGVQQGYATAATDTGHTGPGASFATGHPEKLRDFAERAVHETAVTARGLVAAFYGTAPRQAYFNGCSTGGRQALTEAQRFPDDFDGIVAGAPGNYTTRQAFGQVWIAQAAQRSEASALTSAKLALLHDAVMSACDAKDGVKDGVLEDPTRCTFDPRALLCPDRDASTGSGQAVCLTAPQVLAVQQIYAGAAHPRSGEPIFPGLERGSELAWGRWFGAQPADYATDFFKHIVFRNTSWDFRTLNFDSDLAAADQAGQILDATDPDLRRFFSRGGKLLLYAGWSDPGIAPRNVVNYFQRVRSTVGESADGSVRLFMVPGMEHCGGGNGTSTIDLLGTIERWVERGIAPARIDAARLTNGAVDRTRPLCPYPQAATYSGSGSTDVAASFTCR